MLNISQIISICYALSNKNNCTKSLLFRVRVRVRVRFRVSIVDKLRVWLGLGLGLGLKKR